MSVMSDVVAYWNKQAEAFDEAPDHGLLDVSIREAWASLLVQLVPPAPVRIADIGCGTGTLTVLLAQAGHELSGIDIAPAMVSRARAKAAAAGVDVQLEVADAADPPWSAGSFDVVMARHVLWALDDRGGVLDRWLELLKPEGLLILIEGRWSTGAGLTGAETLELVRTHDRDATLTPLPDPLLWGGPIADERYLLVSSPVTTWRRATGA